MAKHSELTTFQKQVKLLYISELLEKDEEFDQEIKKALGRALKKNPAISKVISFEEMDDNARLDIIQPIDK